MTYSWGVARLPMTPNERLFLSHGSRITLYGRNPRIANFFMVRNSRKQKQTQLELAEKLKPGAEVMTSFGLFCHCPRHG